MLRILGASGRLCDSWSRRESLTIGSLSLLGLNLSDVLHRRAMADTARNAAIGQRSDGFGRAQSVFSSICKAHPARSLR